MPVADLLRDPAIRDSAKADPVRGLTKDFVLRRVRRLIGEDPTLRDPRTAGDLTPDGTVVVGAKLAVELPRVQDAYVEIWKRVSVDQSHLDLTKAVNLTRVTTRAPLGPQKMRHLLVATIVYQAVAADVALAETANVERLHVLSDRRLRIVERMLYDVGAVERPKRRWSRSQIASHRGGPWPDGYERAFEDPRVPQTVFLEACDPAVDDDVCSVPMADWRIRGADDLVGPMHTNPATTAQWQLDPNDPLRINLLLGPGPLDAIAAIEKLFAPATDYLLRNLLSCDHVVHALHLEAFVFSRKKRVGRPGGPIDTRWLETERASKPAGWLRLSSPFRGDAQFLAGRAEPAHFEQQAVRAPDLQPGDHAVVANHAAYANATVAGARRLETALVVETHPKLLLQGHGSLLRDLGAMTQDVVKRFNDELDQRRADVEGLATVTATAGPSQVRVDSVRWLRLGMRVSIANPGTDADLGVSRHIVGIDPPTRTVRYDGGNISTVRAGTVLRRERRIASSGFMEIPVDGLIIRRRVRVHEPSTYAGRDQRADWFLGWDVVDEEEKALRTDATKAAQRAFVRDQQLIEYTVNQAEGEPKTWGWFPLWQPSLNKSGVPRRVDGLIVNTKAVKVGPKHIAGWTWLKDPNPATRDVVPVLRPREA